MDARPDEPAELGTRSADGTITWRVCELVAATAARFRVLIDGRAHCPQECGAALGAPRHRSQYTMTESAKMSALRQQKWRARQRDGKIVVAIEVDEKVTAWLINANLLADEESYDRQKVAVALARAINLSIL